MSIVRSEWESSIEAYVRERYPALKIETNNRSIVPSRNVSGSYFELDIFIPEISLAIEVNGETYHDRETYQQDKMHGTQNSTEMYKENYCRGVGIHLMQVWSSESAESIQGRIDRVIQQRRLDPTVVEWHPPRPTSIASTAASLSPEGCGLLMWIVGVVLSLAVMTFSSCNASKVAQEREIQHQEYEASQEAELARDRESAEQELRQQDYQSAYDNWEYELNDVIRWSNSDAPLSYLITTADGIIMEMEMYDLDDLPDDYRSAHNELLAYAREFRSSLR